MFNNLQGCVGNYQRVKSLQGKSNDTCKGEGVRIAWKLPETENDLE